MENNENKIPEYFIRCSSDKMEQVMNEYPEALFIHQHDENETGEVIKDNLYIGDCRVTDNYNSSAEDDWTTEKIGGMNSMKAFELKRKSVSEVLDMILYPTKNPTKTDPSFTFNYTGTTLIEVGDTLPSEDDFSISNVSRGTLTFKNSEGNTYYAGEKTGESITGNFGGESVEGTYTYTANVTFAEGAQPLNNKGGSEGVISKYTGSIVTKTVTIKSVYSIEINDDDITVMTPRLLDYNTLQTLYVTIPDEIDGTLDKFKINLPYVFSVFNVYQENPTKEGVYDIYVNMELIEGETSKYIRTKDVWLTNGSAKYKIELKK